MPDTGPYPLPAMPATWHVQGRECTDLPGVATFAGWTDVDTAAHTAAPDFPDPLETIGGRAWYPLADVDAYLAALAARGQIRPLRPIAPGDPLDLLHDDDIAAALGVDPLVFDHLVRLSAPYWQAAAEGRELAGRAPLPSPDISVSVVDTGQLMNRQWYRSTIADHQAGRARPVYFLGRGPAAK